MPWQMVAFCLDEANIHGRNLFGLHLYLWDHRSLAGDVQLGAVMPNDVLLRSANIDVNGVRNWLGTLRERDAVIAKKRRVLTTPFKASSVCIRDQWTIDGWESEVGYEKSGWQLQHPDIIEIGK